MIFDDGLVGQGAGIFLYRENFFQGAAIVLQIACALGSCRLFPLAALSTVADEIPAAAATPSFVRCFLLQNGVDVLFCFCLCYRAADALLLKVFVKGIEVLRPQVGEADVAVAGSIRLSRSV